MPQPNDGVLSDLVGRLSLDQKVSLLTGQDSWSLRPLPDIGLQSIVMSDGPAGVRGVVWDERDPSFNFPSPTALAATWDRQQLEKAGRGLGVEARRKGVHVVLGPTINLHRTPYAGRHFEAFSEDPWLTADLAAAYVKGLQSLGVAATVKHYVANDSETDRFNVDVRVDERALREVYLLAFEGPVVEGGTWLVMSAYNSVNGVTASENQLLTNPLLEEWNFDGVVVSDWTAVRSIESARHPQDVAMPGPHSVWEESLAEAVRTGDVAEDAIDAKVLRILRLAARVGVLDGYARDETGATEKIDLRTLVRTLSADGMVLLRNDGLLPLNDPASIAVIGEGARFARTQGGGSATVVPASVVSPLEGIRRRWPNSQVDWQQGAVVQRSVTEFERGTYSTPDGEPGLLVRYLDRAGGEKGAEVRHSTALVWFNGDSLGTTSDTVEVSLTYTPEEPTDRVHLGVAGVSDYEVVADGSTVATGRLRTQPGDDPSSVVLNPPFTSVSIPVEGTSVDLEVRFKPLSGGMPDALALKVGLAPPQVDPMSLISKAADVAAGTDLAVVVVGTSAEVESEGFDRDSLQLPGLQDELVRAVAAVNPRTVVVLNSGAPVIAPWVDDVSAVLTAWFPGQEFGDALADVLSGDVEPGGRLPMTWPATEEDLPVGRPVPTEGRLDYREGIHLGYRAWLKEARTPAFPFGHGLGYTEWILTDLGATSPELAGDSQVVVTVTNAGQRPGKCVVQFYLERVSDSTVDRPARWLAGFEAVRLEPGESRRVDVTLARRRFAHWESGAWHVEPGVYRVIAGLSSSDFGPSVEIEVPGPDRAVEATPEERELSLTSDVEAIAKD